jgi:hypothetical protein
LFFLSLSYKPKVKFTFFHSTLKNLHSSTPWSYGRLLTSTPPITWSILLTLFCQNHFLRPGSLTPLPRLDPLGCSLSPVPLPDSTPGSSLPPVPPYPSDPPGLSRPTHPTPGSSLSPVPPDPRPSCPGWKRKDPIPSQWGYPTTPGSSPVKSPFRSVDPSPDPPGAHVMEF